MNWFEKVKRYYDLGLYDNGDVWDFVSYNKITQEEYSEITHREYTDERPND